MRPRALVLLAFLALTPATAQTTSKPKTTKPAAEVTLKGILDQQGNNYVLVPAKLEKPTARLKGAAFKDDNFANYIGEHVVVTGVMTRDRSIDTLQVRTIRVDTEQ